MELSELAREIENAPDPTANARIERSRATVMQGISLPRRRRSRRRWVWGGTAAGTLTAGAIAATVVIAGTVSPLAAPPASAAAVVLNAAADAVIEESDPVLAPGQYLQMRETYDLITLWDGDLDSPYPYGSQPLSESEGAVHQRMIRDLYLPSDRADDWILDDRHVNQVVDVYGDPAALAEHEATVAQMPEGSDTDPGGLKALPQGTSPGGESWGTFSLSYDSMPRDPAELLQWYRDQLATTSDQDWVVFGNVGQFLGTDAMPADLRAASLQALSLLDSVEVARSEGSVTTLKMESPNEVEGLGDILVSELDIDTETGRIVGGRDVYPHRPTDLIPDGVPWVSWTVEVEVVDSAPQP